MKKQQPILGRDSARMAAVFVGESPLRLSAVKNEGAAGLWASRSR
ncbi:hypothetical protein [Paenibacillus lactis]|nr:hypothetical protein [Paenibacillus lactis]